MIIDVHTHIFPRHISQNRDSFFDREPEFELLYNSPKSNLIGAEGLLERMDADGVDKAVVFGFPWRSADLFKAHNDYILETVQQYSDRLIGLGCFDPAHPGGADEADRCLDSGLSGIGELAFYRSGIDETAREGLEPIMEACLSRNVPVMLHTN